MIGLGVLATGSGATALTGATLSNTVSPTADFRVNVDANDLVVRRGANFGSGDQTVSSGLADIPDTSITYVDDVASAGLDGKTTFTAAANGATNGSLNFGVLMPFDAIPTSTNATSTNATNVEYTFPDLLEIENTTGTGKDIVIQYAESITNEAAQDPNGYVTDPGNEAVDGTSTFGAALVSESGGGERELSFDEVANIFDFKVTNTSSGTLQRISPTGSTSPGNTAQIPFRAVHIGANSTESVSLSIDLDQTAGDKIADFVTNESLDTNGGTIQMIDSVFVAETDDINNDTGQGFSVNSP